MAKPRIIKQIVVTLKAVEAAQAIVEEARPHLSRAIALEAARSACVIKEVDGRYQPENIYKARRN